MLIKEGTGYVTVGEFIAESPLNVVVSARRDVYQGRLPADVRVTGDFLEWLNKPLDEGHGASGIQWYSDIRQVKRDLLPEFIGLHAGESKQIEKFAKRSGVLNVNPLGVVGAGAIDGSPPWKAEPLQIWRDWSEVISIMLRFGLLLARREGPVRLGTVTAWHPCDRWAGSLPEQYLSNINNHDWGQQRFILSDWLTELLEIAEGRVVVKVDATGHPEMVIPSLNFRLDVPVNPFRKIVIELIGALSGRRHLDSVWDVCRACGKEYRCQRRTGRCPICSKEAARRSNRESKRRHDERKKAERKVAGIDSGPDPSRDT